VTATGAARLLFLREAPVCAPVVSCQGPMMIPEFARLASITLPARDASIP